MVRITVWQQHLRHLLGLYTVDDNLKSTFNYLPRLYRCCSSAYKVIIKIVSMETDLENVIAVIIVSPDVIL